MKRFIKRLLCSLLYEYKDVYVEWIPITRRGQLRAEAGGKITVLYGFGFKYVTRKYMGGHYVQKYKFTYRRRR